MAKQEFYKFKMKIPGFRLIPKKYEIYDSFSKKLKFTINVKGFGKLRSYFYDINGVELLTAQKLAWVRTSHKWNILKDGEVVATLNKCHTKLLKIGYEIKTEEQTYSASKEHARYSFSDESGKEVFTFDYSNYSDSFAPVLEADVDVDQNFYIGLALMVSFILFAHLYI